MLNVWILPCLITPYLLLFHTLSCLSEYKIPQNRIKMETSMGGCASYWRPHKAWVSADERLSGCTELWLVTAQCAAGSNGLHAWMCLTSRRAFRFTTKTETTCTGSVWVYVCVLFIAEAMQLCLRPQVCLSHHRYNLSSVLWTAVRLFSMWHTEVLSFPFISQ